MPIFQLLQGKSLYTIVMDFTLEQLLNEPYKTVSFKGIRITTKIVNFINSIVKQYSSPTQQHHITYPIANIILLGDHWTVVCP